MSKFAGMRYVLLASGALLLAQGAMAQEANKPDTGVAEIVVTAQFQSQKLQDTPLAITAINASGLEAR